ncbi:MAG: trehalose-phosphatase [Nocardioidaceae bacterium]
MTFEPSTEAGRTALAEVLADPSATLVALDFDGTLAPIVDDPEQAYIHPDALTVLARLSPRLGAIAVITGRPVDTVLRLGGFAESSALPALQVLGQYGAERWDAATGETTVSPPPPGLETARRALPAFLRDHGAEDAYVEDKGRALGIHVRRMERPDEAYQRLLGPVRRFAARHQLALEPGKLVLEIRADGVDKGSSLHRLLAEPGLSVPIFAGDDLGDIAAYDEVDRLRGAGGAGLLVYATSAEGTVLAKRADVVVDGPRGLVAWLSYLADRLGA